MIARWPNDCPEGKTSPTWSDTVPYDRPGRTSARFTFDDRQLAVFYHNGEEWVRSASYRFEDSLGGGWTDPADVVAFPTLISLGGSVRYDGVSWESCYVFDLNCTTGGRSADQKPHNGPDVGAKE